MIDFNGRGIFSIIIFNKWITIIQSNEQENSTNTITFTISESDYDEAKKVTERIAEELGAGQVVGDKNIAKVSVVGVGMISKPGVAATMFKILGDNDVNIQLITTSEIKISCAIQSDHAEKAVNALHAAFKLDLVWWLINYLHTYFVIY